MATRHVDIVIEGGRLSALYEDLETVMGDDVSLMNSIGNLTTRRASHVEPYGSEGWIADMGPVGGPILGPVKLRRDALALERGYMVEHFGIGGS